MRVMIFALLLVAGCSAPTPLRSADTSVDDAERTDHDSPPMGDEICLSSEQFDALADFECPTVEAVSCPAVEVTCADAPVTVTCECPDVAVVCEPEIVEVEVPATECPEPEVCECEAPPTETGCTEEEVESTCAIGVPTLQDVCMHEITARQGHQPYYPDQLSCSYEGPYAGLCSTGTFFSVEFFGSCAPRLVKSFALRLGKFNGASLVTVDYFGVFDGEHFGSGALASINFGLVDGAFTSVALNVQHDASTAGLDAQFLVSHLGGDEYAIPATGVATMNISMQRRLDAPEGSYRLTLERLTTTAMDGTDIHEVDEVFWSEEFEILGPPEPEPDDAVPPRFINVSNPVPLNPRGVQRVLEFRRCAGSQPLTMVELQFILGEYTEGAEGNAWRTRSPCEVLDCGTISVAWSVEDGSDGTAVVPLAPRTEASVEIATPFDWESTVISPDRCAYFSIEMETRTDAPIGRYTISTQYFAERIEGEEDVSLTAPLLRGSEIIVLE